ncbi:MAG: FxsA family protein [Acidimicrobiia bacterium]|nr:FxsA family protein [Acidimicrobiia bacterium]
MTLLALVLIFVVGPIVELYVIIQVAHVIGGWETIALLLVESFIGAWLMKQQGRMALRRLTQSLDAGRMPTKELVDGGLILFAGALMIAPGFITDALGYLLLIPPTRAVFRGLLMRRFRSRIELGRSVGPRLRMFTFGGRGDVYDTTGREQGRRELP